MAKISTVFLFCVFLILPFIAFSQVVPVPSHPPDGATDQPTTVTLRWVPVLLASSYDVHVSTSSDFRSITKNVNVNSTAVQVNGLAEGITYYWRVRAIITLVPGLWSATARFTTVQPTPQVPQKPTLTSPPNGSVNQPLNLTLDWNAASGADSYTIQVSSDNSFSSAVVNQSGINGTSRAVSGILPGTAYYWRVSAQNSAGSSGWSDIWSFTTKINAPSVPTLVSPANGVTGQPTVLTFDWNESSGAESYTMQVSTSNTFSPLVVNREELTGTSSEVTALSPGTVYFWRVNARNSAGSSAWSEIWSFATQGDRPSAPILVAPANGATGQPASLTFSWNSVPEAVDYQLQVAPNAEFTGPIPVDATLTTTSREVTGLSSGTLYYWRVRARNSSGNGNWSEIWTFTTATGDSSGTYRLNTTISFPDHQNLADYSPADYKIIGLPGASGSPLSDLLPGTAGRDWQAYWDNGKESDYWVAYDGGPTFVFSVGRAFWILKRGRWIIDMAVPPPSTNADGEVEIPLHEGWNLITCPYLLPVHWAAVQQLNSTNEPLYRFTDGRYANAGYLEPYNGYYVFNENSSGVLLIPPDSSPGPPNREIAGNSATSMGKWGEWRIRITATNGIVTDDLLELGSSENATTGKDPVDVHKPRPVSGFGSYFNRPEWHAQHSSFATDIRPAGGSYEQWNFFIESQEPSDIRLSFSGVKEIPSHLGVMLVDEQSSTVIDVRNNEEYLLSSHSGMRPMSILVGNAADIAEAAQRLSVPGSFALGANFPNPFNPSTVIPFEVPKESEVQITVHDVLGRQIIVLLSGTVRGGRHEVLWDGRDEAGRTVSSGTYFCRLTVPGKASLARVMTLTK